MDEGGAEPLRTSRAFLALILVRIFGTGLAETSSQWPSEKGNNLNSVGNAAVCGCTLGRVPAYLCTVTIGYL
jgi:hypothetical protein